MPEENEERRDNVRKSLFLFVQKIQNESTELVPLQAWCLCLPQRSLRRNDDCRENSEQSKKKKCFGK